MDTEEEMLRLRVRLRLKVRFMPDLQEDEDKKWRRDLRGVSVSVRTWIRSRVMASVRANSKDIKDACPSSV